MQSIIDELLKAKDLPLEKMLQEFETIKKKVEADSLKIGSTYAGGIVFYIDKTGKHGLVCAEKDFGEAVWGGDGVIGATGDGIADGSGMENTKLIVEHASWYVQKGLFSTTKTPAQTAARLCLESTYNGYTDWYLPTTAELLMIFHKKSIYDLCNFTSGRRYWSSTEDAKIFGAEILANLIRYDYIINEGELENGIRNKIHNVRGIRFF